jgi:hypothetical protein
MEIDKHSNESELKILRDVLTDEQIDALVSLLQKTFVESFFGFEPEQENQVVEFENEKDVA